MERKVVLITGANSGIGRAAALQIAGQGHHTVLAARNRQKGEAALQAVREQAQSNAVELRLVDMSSQASIRQMAAAFLAEHDRLDALIHNAAIFDITQKERVLTAEGIESVWATNHIGPVLLTACLWDALRQSEQARVLTVASKGLIAKPFLKVDLADPEFEKRRFRMETAYYQSKLAQIMFGYWLAEQQAGTGLTANSIRVPAVRVDISKYDGLPGILQKLYAVKSRFALAPEEMATVYTRLATDPAYATVTGAYFDEKLNRVQPSAYARQAENVAAVMALTGRYVDIEPLRRKR
ncbi:MAG: SDR family NAD(P)-dependent oxidoreductase [Chloroflexi bacterium]|jgi:NAD(P)-dependent dehydrogenase (short-subunit alcohol dehydrogenase family)|nr:SDR family NAD(P)-dependent oxidoreductase [Chloroflexota bacterium]